MGDKFKLVDIKNPFNYKNSRSVTEVDVSDLPVSEYVPKSESKMLVTLNGKTIDEEEQRSLVPKKDDYITIRPAVQGSNLLDALLGIVLIVVAVALTPIIAGATTFAAAMSTTAGMIAFGAIMTVGGMLISALTAPSMPSMDFGTGAESSTSYGWNGITSSQGQGGPIPITFGTVRTGGQVLSSHVTTVDDKQYLNILLSGGEGELDGIWDVRIDDNPISNYDGVAIDSRIGTNNQSVMGYFFDVPSDIALSYLLEVGNPQYQQIDGDSAQALEITLEFPNGLFHQNDDGSAGVTAVGIHADYRRRVSAEGVLPEVYGAWSTLMDEQISSSKTSALRISRRVDNLTPGKYEVYVQKMWESGSTLRFVNKCYWTILSHFLYDDFSMPGMALLGVRALATDQLSGGTPNITWMQSRTNVYVWNPNTSTYVAKPANNPAWACYDLIHYCRRIINIHTGQYEFVVYGNPASRMDYQAFSAWASFCTEKDLQFDLIIDYFDDFWKIVSAPESVGRGKVVLKGTKYSCIFDAVSVPVQQFTMGNIISQSFTEEFLSQKDRANAVEISYFDRNKFYQRETLIVYGDDYDSSSRVPNISQLTLYGCTRASQAYREGRFRLNLNKYLIRTITFDADIDAIACQVGDVINFQHDVPQWGFGGRVEAATANSLTLDQEVTMEPGVTYSVLVTLNNGTVVERDLQGVSEVTNVSTVFPLTVFNNTSNEPLPETYNVYSFGVKNLATKPFRITQINRTGEFRRRITAVEYVPEVYEEDAVIPELDYSALSLDLLSLSAMSRKDSVGNMYLHIYWTPGRELYGGAIVLVDGVKKAEVGMFTTEVSLSNVLVASKDTYYITVIPVSTIGKKGTPKKLTYTLESPVPVAMTASATQNGRFVDFSWDTVVGAVSYQIRQGTAWDSAVMIANGVSINGYRLSLTPNNIGTNNFMVCAYGADGGVISIPTAVNVSVTNWVPSVSNVLTEENTIINRDGTVMTNVNVSFSPPVFDYIDHYNVYFALNGSTTFLPVGSTSDNTFTISGLQNTGTIIVKISVVDRSGMEGALIASASLELVGKSLPPSNVTGLTLQQKVTDRSTVVLNWNGVSDVDLNCYEIRMGNNWSTAQIVATQLKSTVYSYTATSSAYRNFMVCALDNSGNYSVTPASSGMQLTITPDSPTNLVATPLDTNRAVIQLSWNAVSGGDLDGYEIRYGDNWDTGIVLAKVAETRYEWIHSISGVYQVMVRAKTIAGFYSLSSAVISSLIVTVEPENVTGFTATQSINDRTKVTLHWDAPTVHDISHYIIKKGTAWESANIVGNRVTGVSYEVTVIEETSQTFLIKAVSAAGKESLTPAVVTDLYSLRPNAVSNIVLAQTVSDKTILRITWEANMETDLAYYDVRLGYSWDSAMSIGHTKEQQWEYVIPSSSTINILIKAVSVAGFYSDESTAFIQAVVEPTPVSGLKAYQNGETVELYWTKHPETDVLFYEVREGATFAQGALVATGITQPEYIVKVDVERLYRYHVKAINRAGYYSLMEASASITVENLPVKNIIATYDQIALASGTHSNTEFGTSLINFSNIGGKWSDYPSTKFSDVGGATVLKLKDNNPGGTPSYSASGTYTTAIIDAGAVITANIAAQFISTVVLNGTGTAILQVRTSQNGTDYSNWVDFKPVQYTFRYIQFRVSMTTTDATKTPEVNQFTISADVPDHVFYKTVTIAQGGTTVAYGHNYYSMVVLIPTAIGDGLHAELVSKGLSSCLIKVKNASNVDVGGTVDLQGRGY